MERTIVGIDPSLTATAVVRGGIAGHELETFGSKACGADPESRIGRFVNQAISVMQFAGRHLPVFIEGYSFQSKGCAISSICEYGGLLRRELLEAGCEVYEVPPSTLKKFATGKGNIAKDLVPPHLTKRYGVLLNSNDEYDAYALYRFGLVAMGLDKPANQAQQEAVDAVMNPKPKKSKPRRVTK